MTDTNKIPYIDIDTDSWIDTIPDIDIDTDSWNHYYRIALLVLPIGIFSFCVPHSSFASPNSSSQTTVTVVVDNSSNRLSEEGFLKLKNKMSKIDSKSEDQRQLVSSLIKNKNAERSIIYLKIEANCLFKYKNSEKLIQAEENELLFLQSNNIIDPRLGELYETIKIKRRFIDLANIICELDGKTRIQSSQGRDLSSTYVKYQNDCCVAKLEKKGLFKKLSENQRSQLAAIDLGNLLIDEQLITFSDLMNEIDQIHRETLSIRKRLIDIISESEHFVVTTQDQYDLVLKINEFKAKFTLEEMARKNAGTLQLIESNNLKLWEMTQILKDE